MWVVVLGWSNHSLNSRYRYESFQDHLDPSSHGGDRCADLCVRFAVKIVPKYTRFMAQIRPKFARINLQMHQFDVFNMPYNVPLSGRCTSQILPKYTSFAA